MATTHSLRTPAGIQHILQALNCADDHDANSNAVLTSVDEVQTILDEIWNVLDSPILPDAASGGPQFFIYRNNLRKACLKIAIKHNILPTRLILRGVRLIDHTQHGAGGFADVYCGTYRELKVALKRLRVYVASSEAKKQEIKKAFYRESILWKNLVHDHVLPFLGVSEDVFEGTFCMVLPWQENGSLRHHSDKLRNQRGLSDAEFAATVDKWLHQTALGLEYLHIEGIVHGDIHAGNILVDANGHACLADFGMSLIAEATGYAYASIHGGGATRWQAPELIDPEEFGLESSRPTPQSDVFSFACTAVELYSGEPPLPSLTDRQVSNRYILGRRPPCPSLPGGGTLAEPMWSLIEMCWAQEASERPSSGQLVVALTTIVPGASGLNQHFEQTNFFDISLDHSSSTGTTSAPQRPGLAVTVPISQGAATVPQTTEITSPATIQVPTSAPYAHIPSAPRRSGEIARDLHTAVGDRRTPLSSQLIDFTVSAPGQSSRQASIPRIGNGTLPRHSPRHVSPAPRSPSLTAARLQIAIRDAIVGMGDDVDFSPEHIKSMFETLKDLALSTTLSRAEMETLGATVFQIMHMIAWLWESLRTNNRIPPLHPSFDLLLRFISLFIRVKLSDDSDANADDGESLLARALALDGFDSEDTQLVVLGKLKCWDGLRWTRQSKGDYSCGCKWHWVFKPEVQQGIRDTAALKFPRDLRRCGMPALVLLKRITLLKERLDRCGYLKTMSPARRSELFTSPDVKKGAILILEILRIPHRMQSNLDDILAVVPVYHPLTLTRVWSFSALESDVLDPLTRVLELWVEKVGT